MPKKITEVSLAASLAPADNPTFYVEKGGVFRRVSFAQLEGCLNEGVTATPFSAETAYSAGEYVVYNGQLYCFTEAHAAGAWTGSDASACTMADEMRLVKSHLEAVDATLITEEASGTIASFADGADGYPMRSVEVSMEPIQDLHGQANPYPAGGGKNLVDWTGPQTITGQTTLTTYMTSEQTVFTVSVSGYKNNSINGRLNLYAYNGAALVKQKIGVISSTTAARVSATLDMTGETYDRFLIVITGEASGYSITVSDLQLEKNSTATDYAPYSNICPISGRESVTVTRAGVNVWDEEWEAGTYLNTNGTKYPSTSKIRNVNPISVKPNTQYYYHVGSTSADEDRIWCYDSEMNFLRSIGFAHQTTIMQTFTTPDKCEYINFSVKNTIYGNDISINYPSTDHDYHPGTVASVEVQLGQTVYGGTVDLVSGEMTVDRAMVDMGSLTWSNYLTSTKMLYMSAPSDFDVTLDSGYARFVSSEYPTITRAQVGSVSSGVGIDGNGNYLFVVNNTGAWDSFTSVAEAKATLSGVQLCYELAEPITVQLAPEQLTTVLGQNNVWSDADSISVDYVADTKLYISKVISAAVAALS